MCIRDSHYSLNPVISNWVLIDGGTWNTSHWHANHGWSSAYHYGIRKVTRAARAETTIYATEGYVNYNMWSNGTFTYHSSVPHNSAAVTSFPAPEGNGNYRWRYHSNKGNHIFVDGHVQALSTHWIKIPSNQGQYFRMGTGRPAQLP